MITVIVYGLDQYIVGHLSRDLTPNLAKIYEVDEDEINFIAPENMVLHNGVEQTSWNAIIHVHAPIKTNIIQEDAVKVIFDGIGDVAINITVEFYYYSQDNRYTKMNPDYPRYITESNLVNSEEEYSEDEEDSGPELEEGEGDGQIYTGNIFKDFKG